MTMQAAEGTSTQPVLSPAPLGTANGVADWGVTGTGTSTVSAGHSTYLGKCPVTGCTTSVYHRADAPDETQACEEGPRSCHSGPLRRGHVRAVSCRWCQVVVVAPALPRRPERAEDHRAKWIRSR